MTYLIHALALPIVLAVILGLIVGWLTLGRDPAETQRSWLSLGLTVFAVGVYAATVHIVPGREGFWLETGLLLFAGYIVGCTIGHALRRLSLGADAFGDATLATAGAGTVRALSATTEPSGPDDLTLIWGVGAKLAVTLNGMGIHHFRQIANWSEADMLKFESHAPEFRGRVSRDEWIEQCKKLAAGWRPANAVGDRHPGT